LARDISKVLELRTIQKVMGSKALQMA